MAYRYTDPVFNAMVGARTPFQVPGLPQHAHIPPRMLARRKPVRVWHPPCPDRTKPTHKEVVLCIRSLQEQGQIPNPYPSIPPAARDDKRWTETLDFLPLPGPAVAGAATLPVCSTGEDCQTQAAQSQQEDELQAWNRAHTFLRSATSCFSSAIRLTAHIANARMAYRIPNATTWALCRSVGKSVRVLKSIWAL